MPPKTKLKPKKTKDGGGGGNNNTAAPDNGEDIFSYPTKIKIPDRNNLFRAAKELAA